MNGTRDGNGKRNKGHKRTQRNPQGRSLPIKILRRQPGLAERAMWQKRIRRSCSLPHHHRPRRHWCPSIPVVVNGQLRKHDVYASDACATARIARCGLCAVCRPCWRWLAVDCCGCCGRCVVVVIVGDEGRGWRPCQRIIGEIYIYYSAHRDLSEIV